MKEPSQVVIVNGPAHIHVTSGEAGLYHFIYPDRKTLNIANYTITLKTCIENESGKKEGIITIEYFHN